MTPKIEEVVRGHVDIYKVWRLQSRFEPAHTSLPN